MARMLLPCPTAAGSVEFDHVRFRYVDDVPLIEDMT